MTAFPNASCLHPMKFQHASRRKQTHCMQDACKWDPPFSAFNLKSPVAAIEFDEAQSLHECPFLTLYVSTGNIATCSATPALAPATMWVKNDPLLGSQSSQSSSQLAIAQSAVKREKLFGLSLTGFALPIDLFDQYTEIFIYEVCSTKPGY